MQHGGFPALVRGIGGDAFAQGRRIERSAISVIRILDEDLVRPHRQEIDETIGAVLPDRRIHDNGAVDPVRASGAQVLAEEDLPAAGQMLAGPGIAAVDDGARLHALSGRKLDPRSIEALDPRAELLGFLRQFSAQRAVEIAAVERAVVGGQHAPVRGEADLVAAGPFGPGEGCEQRLALLRQIAFEPAPAVVAAEAVARLEQGERERRVRAADRQRGKAAGEPTSYDRDVEPAAHGESRLRAQGQRGNRFARFWLG